MTGGNKIKLIEIIADSSLGGGPKHVLGLIQNIDKELFDVYIICPGGYLSAEAKQVNDVNVFNVAMRGKFDLASFWEIKKIINNIRVGNNPFGPLIVHTHGPRAGLMGRLAAPVHAKKVHTEHIFDIDYHLKNPLNEWLQRKFLQVQNYRSDLIIAVSNSVKKFLTQSKMAPEKKIVVIPNGIEIRKPKTELRTPSSELRTPVIGTIGNLNFQKGQIYLIEAMPKVLKKYPLATLEIIGEGEERTVLETEIKKLGIEKHVTLFGHKNIIERYMQYWNLFVLPSISETFGIAVLEAMNYGLPVVATKVGGVPDIITHRKNGILVEPKNSEALAGAILDVLDHPAIAAKLKREGMQRVQDFDWKVITRKIETEFKKLFS